MDSETMTQYCKICGEELELDNATDICFSCQSIISNQNMNVKGF